MGAWRCLLNGSQSTDFSLPAPLFASKVPFLTIPDRKSSCHRKSLQKSHFDGMKKNLGVSAGNTVTRKVAKLLNRFKSSRTQHRLRQLLVFRAAVLLKNAAELGQGVIGSLCF